MNDHHTRGGRTELVVMLRGFAWACAAWIVILYAASPSNPFSVAGDALPLATYALLFSALATATGLIVYRRLTFAHRPLRYVTGAAMGLLTGVAFCAAGTALGSLVVGGGSRSLADWLRMSNGPLLTASVGAGIISVAAAVGTHPRATRLWIVAEQLSFVLLLTILAWELPLAAGALNRDQHLTIVYANLYNDGTRLEIDDARGLLLPGDRALLARAAIAGRVVVQAGEATSTVARPKARMIILMSGPVTQRVRLLQPKAMDVLYTQVGAAFERFPADASVLDRAVTLSPAPARGTINVTVEQARGTSARDVSNWLPME